MVFKQFLSREERLFVARRWELFEKLNFQFSFAAISEITRLSSSTFYWESIIEEFKGIE